MESLRTPEEQMKFEWMREALEKLSKRLKKVEKPDPVTFQEPHIKRDGEIQ